MTVGDLIKVDHFLYPKLEGHVGVLVEVLYGGKSWVVYIGDRIHPYTIVDDDMEVISESR